MEMLRTNYIACSGKRNRIFRIALKHIWPLFALTDLTIHASATESKNRSFFQFSGSSRQGQELEAGIPCMRIICVVQ